MGARVTITWDGMEQVLSNLTKIEEKGQENLVKQTAELAKATEADWKDITPRKSGRLQDADVSRPAGLSFTLENNVYYYKFLDEGHMTPRGWRTRHGYRPAKRRSHVEARLMTERAIGFIEDNIEEYLSRFLDGV